MEVDCEHKSADKRNKNAALFSAEYSMKVSHSTTRSIAEIGTPMISYLRYEGTRNQ